MKEEMISLKREATEAKGNEATWATKYEALDRNFKQVNGVRSRASCERPAVVEWNLTVRACCSGSIQLTTASSLQWPRGRESF